MHHCIAFYIIVSSFFSIFISGAICQPPTVKPDNLSTKTADMKKILDLVYEYGAATWYHDYVKDNYSEKLAERIKFDNVNVNEDNVWGFSHKIHDELDSLVGQVKAIKNDDDEFIANKLAMKYYTNRKGQFIARDPQSIEDIVYEQRRLADYWEDVPELDKLHKEMQKKHSYLYSFHNLSHDELIVFAKALHSLGEKAALDAR